MIGSLIGAAIFGTLLGPLLGTAAVTARHPPGVQRARRDRGRSWPLDTWRHPEPRHRRDRRRAAGHAAHHGRRPARDGLWHGAWLVLIDAMSTGAVNALLPLRLSRLGASGVAIGATFVLASAVATLLAPVIGRASDRHGARRPMTLGLTFSAALFAAHDPAGRRVPLAAVSVLLLGGPMSAFMIPAVPMMTASAERVGVTVVVATSLVNLAYAVGETIGAPTAALLSHASSDAVPFSRPRRDHAHLAARSSLAPTARPGRPDAGRRPRPRPRSPHARRRITPPPYPDRDPSTAPRTTQAEYSRVRLPPRSRRRATPPSSGRAPEPAAVAQGTRPPPPSP